MNEYIFEDKYAKFYYKDKEKSLFHREDGPAIEYANGNKVWYQNDKLHRMDGPAFATADGYKEWWVDGEFIFSVNEQNNIINRMR